MARRKRARTTHGADLMLAPMVMMMRLPLMAAEARNLPARATESTLAASEKASAVAEGIVAAQLSLVRSAASFWPDLMAGRTPTLLSGAAAQASVDAAMRPLGRAVKANFVRLSKGTGKP